MQVNEENITWAIGKLHRLSFLPGAPILLAAWEGMAWGFLRIVYNEPKEHPKLGKIDNDADWLIGHFIETAERWPSVAEMREYYSHWFKPATEPPVRSNLHG